MRRIRGPRSTASTTSSSSGTTPGIVSSRGGKGKSNFIKSVMRVSGTRDVPQRRRLEGAGILVGVLVRNGRIFLQGDPAQYAAQRRQARRDQRADSQRYTWSNARGQFSRAR